MQSWQLQGAACCGITRGLRRDCKDRAQEFTFDLKTIPSDFCVNEVSIKGTVADVTAAPPADEVDPPDNADPEGACSRCDEGLQSLDGALAIPDSHNYTSDSTSLIASAESVAETLRSCFADDSEWSRAKEDLTAIAESFFCNPRPHDLFAPRLLMLSDTARADKLLRKRAYNIVRSMFPFVSLTTPSPPG
jgi:hypothetical protein